VEYSVTGRYMHIAGIVGAVLAAVPGIIDFIFVVPPDSSAKKRGATHGLINTIVLVFFVIALYLKYRDISPYVILVVEVIAVTLTAIAGWMGGTLVHRNQIGVDIRYARAGKWTELYIDEKTGPFEVCVADELEVDQMKLIHTKDKRIVIARTENGYIAFDDRCTHRGASLAVGAMICGTVQCPWHGSQFDVATGEVKAGPARDKIDTYPIKETEGKVYLII
ncbi:MAG: Rieske 2Fe-2S domain-containing protein, partial [Chitinophagaceae bacterium]|nr:Rieske 2Fe-2S domain-containing protein [Chitinophagaceae bacterium]